MDYESLWNDLERIGNLLEKKDFDVLKYRVQDRRKDAVEANQLDVLFEGLIELKGDSVLDENKGLEASVYFFKERTSPYDRIVYRPDAIEGSIEPIIFERDDRLEEETESYIKDVHEVIEEF